MDTHNLHDPVGDLPPGTYWRRRALVLVAVLAAAGLAAWACAATGDAHRSGRLPAGAQGPLPTALPTVTTTVTVTATPVSSPSPSGSPSPSRAGPVRCEAADLAVAVKADEDSYAPKEMPVFTLTVANSGDRPCRADVGQQALSLIVTSGHDRIWSADDCDKKARSRTRTLRPGKAYETTIEWHRRRSSPDDCRGKEETAKPGWYVATPRVGDVEGEKAVFRLR